jgi:hypothetical protein
MVLLAEEIALILTDSAYIFHCLNLLSIYTHAKMTCSPALLDEQELVIQFTEGVV